MFECFWERFWAFSKCESFSSFLKLFQVLTFLGALGTFFPRKLPQNKFKTCLDTFRHVYGHFWNFKSPIIFSFFSIFRPCRAWWFQKTTPRNMFELCWVRFWTFLKIWFFFRFFFEFFQVSTLQCVLAISFRKKYLKTSSELVWTLLGTISDTLENLKFSIFSIFFLSNLQGALSNNFSEKISSNDVQNMFDCFWERFWAIWKCESFSSFLKLFQFSTFLGALGSFFGESYLKTSSKHVWTLLGTFLDTFEISKLRFYFAFFSIFRPCRALWFQKKSPRNMFEHCWVRFWSFLKLCFFSICISIFSNLDPPV